MTGNLRDPRQTNSLSYTALRFDSIDSTNTEALKQARLGADEGLCVGARQQTAGRGRQGRSWISPKDSGLYLSVVLRPQLDAKFLPMITLAAAVAVFDTLAELGLRPDIKWPNDVLVNNKKICGVLAETAETKAGLAVVVGIGINVTSESFPPDIAERATSVETELGRVVTFSEVEGPLLKLFDEQYSRLTGLDGPAAIIRSWSMRSTYFAEKAVRVVLDGHFITGVTDGLESNGALRVKQNDGTFTVIQAGDVESLREQTN